LLCDILWADPDPSITVRILHYCCHPCEVLEHVAFCSPSCTSFVSTGLG
jgi:hypothetical protein